MRPLVCTLALFTLLAAGCGGPVIGELNRTMKDVDGKEYEVAATRCQWLHSQESKMNEKAAMRFRVYCGLAYYNVNKPNRAYKYLKSGDAMYRSLNPAWLPPETVDAMEQTLAKLEGKASGAEEAE